MTLQPEMTVQNAINRGYNLLACTALALAGLAFGTVVLVESDVLDKVDDIGFLVIGTLAVIWYLAGRNRFQRSVVPIILAGIAVIVEIAGLVLEKDVPASFGDNIGGLWFFLPLFVVLIVQFYLNRRHLMASAEVTSSAMSSES
jgi:hypothetical protein